MTLPGDAQQVQASWSERGPASASFVVPVANAHLGAPAGLRRGAWVEIYDRAHLLWDGEVRSLKPVTPAVGAHYFEVQCAGLPAIAGDRGDLRTLWVNRGAKGWARRIGSSEIGTVATDNGVLRLRVAEGATEDYAASTIANVLAATFCLHDGLSDDEISYCSYAGTYDVTTEGGGYNWRWNLWTGPSAVGPWTAIGTAWGAAAGSMSGSFTPPAGTKAILCEVYCLSAAHTVDADKFVEFTTFDIFSSGRTTKPRLDEAMVAVMTRPGLCTSVVSRRVGGPQDDLAIGTGTAPTNAAAGLDTLAALHSQPVDWRFGLRRTGYVGPYLWTPDNDAKVIMVGPDLPGLLPGGWEIVDFDEGGAPDCVEVTFGNKDSAACPEGYPRRIFRPGPPGDDNSRVVPLDLSRCILTDAAARAAGDQLVGRAPSEIPGDYIFRVHGDRFRSGLWPADNADLLNRAAIQDISDGRAVGTVVGCTYVDGSGHSGSGSPADPSCIELDGTGDYVAFGDLAALDLGVGARSICSWVRVDNVATSRAIFAKRVNSGNYTGWGLWVDNAAKVVACVSSVWPASARQATSNAAITLGVWHHIAAVYAGSGGEWTLYVDGAEVASTATGAAGAWNSDNAASAALGAWDPTGTPGIYMLGAIAACDIYRRALSVAEVAQAYAAGPCLYDRSLAKGTVTLQGTCINRRGASVEATHITPEGYWIQHSTYAGGRPLRITGASVDLAARKNVVTIGPPTAEDKALGLCMAELLAQPARTV